jgi:hypothetical protein
MTVERGAVYGVLRSEWRRQDDDRPHAGGAAATDAGSVRVLGHDVAAEAGAVRGS